MIPRPSLFLFFFFNDTATTEIYTLSLHDALPIYARDAGDRSRFESVCELPDRQSTPRVGDRDRKSTRLNSSHQIISYAVFCLKKKKKKNRETTQVRAKRQQRTRMNKKEGQICRVR